MNIVYIIIYLSIIVCPDQMIEAVLDCNFEAGFCDWKNDSMDDFDWERKTGGTSTWYTGPASDHTTGSGHYIYIEASEKNKGDKSRIMSPWQVSGQYCLTFWYNMHGRDIGALNVYLFENGIETPIFNKNKNIGNRSWWKSVLNIETSDRYQIVLEGVIGDGEEGDIAIDDIEIKPGLFSIDCNFRYDLCNWMQSYDNDFDWYRGNSAAGHYIYVRNNYNTGKSMLKSPLQNAGKFCLDFNLKYKYFQYGWINNSLQIDMRAKNGSKIHSHEPTRNLFWTRIRILISSQDPFQIVFESIFDSLAYTMIAIDEVMMSSCNDCPDPTPNHGIVNNTNFPYGSVIKIYCDHGFTLKGNSVIICRPMERWNGSAECIPHDCGNRIIPNGSFITLNGTTFGQIGRHECDAGFGLVGKQSINCTVNGWSDTSAFCKFVDCGNLTIQNGRFITSNGTTFGQVGKFECHAGFILIGEQRARCLINGWNTSSAYCKILDCGNHKIQNGIFIAPNGTTFGQVGIQECDNGYVLVGEQSSTCTVTGWSNTSAYCQIEESLESDTSPLVVAYVLIPVFVLMIGAVLTVLYMRKKHPRCIKILKTDNKSRNVPTGDSRNRQTHFNQTYNNEVEQIDDEYATIAEGSNNNKGLDTVCYAVVNKKSSKHSSERHSEGRDKTSGEGHRIGLSKYDVPENGHINIPSVSNKEQDSVYDNTFTGKMKTHALSHADYSHLGDVDPNYQHPFNLDMQTAVQDTTDYAHLDGVKSNRKFDTLQPKNGSIVKDTKIPDRQSTKITNSLLEEPDYYNVGTDVEDTDKNGERKSDNLEKHNYFILEKT